MSYKQNRCIVNEHMRNIKPCFVNVNNTAFTEDCILNVILTVVSHIIFYFYIKPVVHILINICFENTTIYMENELYSLSTSFDIDSHYTDT